MKKIAILLCFIALFSNKIFPQCVNADFSLDSFTPGWTGSTGEYTSGGDNYTIQVNGISANPDNSGPFSAGQQTIMTAPGTDPMTNGGLSVLPPGGGYSCRLGNALYEDCDAGSYPQAARLTYTFLVNASNDLFTYQYAVVLQQAGHGPGTNPKFEINVLNSTGTQIGGVCGTYTAVAAVGLPGYTQVTPTTWSDASCNNGSPVLWCNWTSNSIDLSAYVGQNISIAFTAWDCYPGGHFGYAYIQCSCSAPQITQACAGTSDILTGPPGYAAYAWSPSTGLSATTGSPVTLSPGGTYNGQTYTVTCTPATGTACDVVVHTVINVSPVTITTTSDTICAGQTASISATGGGTYAWSDGESTPTANPVPTTTTTYVVTVTASGGGCSNSANATVTVNAMPVAVAGPPQTICPGSTATLDASGSSPGSGVPSYSWSNGVNIATNPVSPAVTTLYTVTVTSNGCTSTDTVSVIVANHLVVTAAPDTTICPTQTVQLTAGGAATYIWSPAATLSSSTANPVIAAPTASITYTVTGSSGSCTASSQVTVNVVNALNLTISNDTTVCPNSTVQLIATGANSYLWSGGSTLADTTVSPAATTTYTVIGTSAGCSASKSVTVTVSNNLPVTVANEAICPGGTATLTAISGATAYVWSTTQTTPSITVTPATTTTYFVTGTDGGCSGTNSATVTVNPNPTIIVTPANPSICPGASTTLQANGASTYVWNPVAGLSSSTGITVTANPIVTTPYTVTGTDINGCTGVGNIIVNVAPITAQADSINAHCSQNDGSATVIAGGNCNQTFTYLWSNSPNPQTNATAINLVAGVYTVTVSCGACTTTASTTVLNLPGPSVAPVHIHSSTCGYANGSATVIATNVNNPPAVYLWSNGQGGDSLTNVVAGPYQITVTDAVGCTATNTLIVPNIPGDSAVISGINPANCGMQNGSATLNVIQGTPGFNYSWNSTPPQTTRNILNVPTGNYCVTVTDSNGCTTSVCVRIPPIAGPSASTISVNEICHKANGTATVNASGGMGPGHYTYLWSNNETTPTDTGLTEGTYYVTVSDGGCSTSESIIVGEIPGPTAGFMYNPKILTILEGPVTFWDRSIGNIANWQWNFGDTSSGLGATIVHPYPNVGVYLVTEIVTDSNGCKDTTSDTVKVVDIFTFYIPSAFTPNNDGVNDLWYPKGMNVDPNNFNEYIYDRWGNLVFQTNQWDATKHQAKIGWNGTLNNNGTYNNVVMDVYVYKIEVREFNDGPKHEYVGRVTLVP